MPHEPPITESTLPTATEAPEKELGEGVQSEVQDALVEERAVRAYLTTNGRAASRQTAGIALLSAVLQQNQGCWRKDTAEQTLALASALGRTWRPDGNLLSIEFDMQTVGFAHTIIVFSIAASHLRVTVV